MRPCTALRPVGCEFGKIINPDTKIRAMPDMRIGGEAPRATLSTPIEGGDIPAQLMPVLENLEVFFDNVAAAALKQD